MLLLEAHDQSFNKVMYVQHNCINTKHTNLNEILGKDVGALAPKMYGKG